MKKVAIYTRKSVYMDTSDSINAQKNICIEYCKANYKNCEIMHFEDEGYTGANLNRPSYKEMLNYIENRLIDAVVVYKIDRLSRSINDFSTVFNLLQKNNIDFISVSEQIDTKTISGRAMMYMSSVFGQMERENIAERVKDTMLDMAKAGYWCGGRAPIGYKIKKIKVDNKTHSTLEIDEKAINYYRTLVNAFIESNKSLTATATELRRKGLRTLNGGLIRAGTIHKLIANPVYVQADENTYNYFKNLGCRIICNKEKFDGSKALLRYGRKEGGQNNKFSLIDKSEWIISVGLHDYLLDSKTFLSVQNSLKHNKINKVRKHEVGLLHRILTCKCGYKMRAVSKDFKTDTKIRHYELYTCTRRDQFGKSECDMESIPIVELDKKVIAILKNISLDRKMIENYTEKPQAPAQKEQIQKQIETTEKQIANLINIISNSKDFNSVKYLMEKLEELDTNLNTLKKEYAEQEQLEKESKNFEEDTETKYNKICELVNNLEKLDYKTLHNALLELIKECRLEGQTLKIKI